MLTADTLELLQEKNCIYSYTPLPNYWKSTPYKIKLKDFTLRSITTSLGPYNFTHNRVIEEIINVEGQVFYRLDTNSRIHISLGERFKTNLDIQIERELGYK